MLKDLQRKQEVSRKRKLVIDEVYPKLISATVSVDEAKMLVQAINSTLMEKVLSWMQERTFSDIADDVLGRITPTDDRKVEVEALLNTLKDENVFVAREIVEGMGRAIDQMVNDEMKNRKLDSLTADWDKMLHNGN